MPSITLHRALYRLIRQAFCTLPLSDTRCDRLGLLRHAGAAIATRQASRGESQHTDAVRPETSRPSAMSPIALAYCLRRCWPSLWRSTCRSSTFFPRTSEWWAKAHPTGRFPYPKFSSSPNIWTASSTAPSPRPSRPLPPSVATLMCWCWPPTRQPLPPKPRRSPALARC